MRNSINYKKIGERIRLKRLGKKMNQSELAEKAGVNVHYLSNVETNNVETVGLQALFTIANALDTNIDYFLSDNLEDNEKISYQEIENTLKKMTSNQRTFTMDLIKFLDDNSDKF